MKTKYEVCQDNEEAEAESVVLRRRRNVNGLPGGSEKLGHLDAEFARGRRELSRRPIEEAAQVKADRGQRPFPSRLCLDAYHAKQHLWVVANAIPGAVPMRGLLIHSQNSMKVSPLRSHQIDSLS